MKVANKTKFPKLFRDVYWGCFEAGKEDPVEETRIINNRNRFVGRHGIAKYVGEAYGTVQTITTALGWVGDHPELYKTHKGAYVLVFSPYDRVAGRIPPALPAIATAAGFKAVPQLYSKATSTYLAEFKTARELKLAAKMLAASPVDRDRP
jgi:hypothetical protein